MEKCSVSRIRRHDWHLLLRIFFSQKIALKSLKRQQKLTNHKVSLLKSKNSSVYANGSIMWYLVSFQFLDWSSSQLFDLHTFEKNVRIEQKAEVQEIQSPPCSEFYGYHAKAEYKLVGYILKNISKMHVAGIFNLLLLFGLI